MNRFKGFTLVELMIVIAILGIITSIFTAEFMDDNTECKRGVLYYVNSWDGSLSPAYDADTGGILRCSDE